MSQDNRLKAKSGETCFLSFFTNQGWSLSTEDAEDPQNLGNLHNTGRHNSARMPLQNTTAL
jgi:hypothetical protein